MNPSIHNSSTDLFISSNSNTMSSSQSSAISGRNEVARGSKSPAYTPLWRHVTLTRESTDGGGNKQWNCTYCGDQFTGSYTKVKAHLLQVRGKGIITCTRVTDAILQELRHEDQAAATLKLRAISEEQQQMDYVTLPPGSDLVQPKRRRGTIQRTIEESNNLLARMEIDKECARMFYTAALPFNLARNIHFRKYSTMLANSNVAGYSPPTYDQLRDSLLTKEKTHVDGLLKPIKDSWVKRGVSICSDGWLDGSRKPIINLMGASGTQAVFLDLVDSSGVRKDAEYVAQIFTQAIEEVGPMNVVQVVTDNGSNFKSAGGLIEKAYPHIFRTPCVVHCLNLAFKSICEPSENAANYDQCQWLLRLCAEVKDIQKFITSHDMIKSIFKKHSKLQLLQVAETRFASHYIVAERMQSVKDGLEKMLMDADWKSLFRSNRSPIDLKAREIKGKLLSDTWWDQVDYFVKFAKPVYEMIRVGDEDAPILHLVYNMWDDMIEKIKVIIFEHDKDLQSGSSEFFTAIQEVLESRWNRSNTPLHCLAHSLVPKFYSTNWLNGGANGFRRVAPHEDEEVSDERHKCFQRLFPNKEEFMRVQKEYGAFCAGLDFFGQTHVIAARDDQEPMSWWANYGSSTPLLQALAFKLLSQPASSSCCECNWSHYDNIQSVKRNRLTSTRARDLVSVHNNLRILARKEKTYKSGHSKYWDIGGDKYDVDAQLLELADLSLNEPEVEAALLETGDEDVIDQLENEDMSLLGLA